MYHQNAIPLLRLRSGGSGRVLRFVSSRGFGDQPIKDIDRITSVE
jgi:hypothetical protein